LNKKRERKSESERREKKIAGAQGEEEGRKRRDPDKADR